MSQDAAATARHAALTKIRASRSGSQISDLDVQAAFDEVCAGGVLPLLESIAHRDRGRPRLLTPAGLWTGMALCSEINRGAVRFDYVADILHYRISPAWRARFAIPDRLDDDRGFEAGYNVVLRLFHVIADGLDASVLPKNHRLPKTTAAALLNDADPRDSEARDARLHVVANSVLESSLLPVRPLLDGDYWDGSVSVDGTVIATWAKGVRSSADYLATDPDAGWYVREGDHRDPDGAIETIAATAAAKNAKPGRKKPTNKQKRRRSKYVFGYDATLVVARDPAHDGTTVGGVGDPARLPALVIAISVGRPGVDPGKHAVKALADAVLRRGYKTRFLAGDRAFNNSDPDDFQLPIRALGYKAVYDYRVDQLGIAAQTHGAIQVEGTWYSPAMPQALVDATADLLAERIDQITWQARIEARRAYALAAKAHPDADGHQRMMCPAAAGKIQCPLKPSSLGSGIHLPLADPQPSPVGVPKICEQLSVTIPPEVGAKHAQELAYGSEDWARVYHRLRNSIEAFNGFAKNDNHEAIERSQRRRVRGIAAQTILLSFQIAHANKRKIAVWVDTLPDPVTGRPRRRPTRRRATRPLGTWTPTGHIDPDDLNQAA